MSSNKITISFNENLFRDIGSIPIDCSLLDIHELSNLLAHFLGVEPIIGNSLSYDQFDDLSWRHTFGTLPKPIRLLNFLDLQLTSENSEQLFSAKSEALTVYNYEAVSLFVPILTRFGHIAIESGFGLKIEIHL